MLLLIVLLVMAAFLPTLQSEFVNWDDDWNFVGNVHYRGLGWTHLRWMFTTFHLGVYQPLSWMVLGLQYLLWGLNPVGYHATSLLLHATNAVLVYCVTLRLFRLAMPPSPEQDPIALPLAAGSGALLFALHPLRVEVVAWVSAQPYALATLFFLLTLLCYLRAATMAADDRTSRRWLRGAVALYALSLLSKAIGMTLPAILLVLDIYPLRRLGGGPGKWFGPTVRRVWVEKVPFLSLALAAGVIALVGEYRVGGVRPLESYGVTARGAQALFGLAFYLWKTVVPLGLSPLYPLPAQLDPFAAPFLLSGAAILTISVGLFVARRRWPAGLAIWLCYVVMLMPVSGVVPIGLHIAADRYSYLSCLGFAILAGAGVLVGWRAYLNGRIVWRLFVVTAGLATLAVAGLGVLTWRQVQVWHDSERLWRHVLATDPESYFAHTKLGLALFHQDKLDEAIHHYRQALETSPGYAQAHLNLGLALARQGKLDAAINHYRQALKTDPTYVYAYNNLGLALARQGKLDEAIEHYRQAVRLQPAYAGAHLNLGVALADQGKLDAAIEHYRQALQLRPSYAEAHYRLADALAKLDKATEAIEHYRKAVEIQPDFAFAHNNLGNVLSGQGKLDAAIEHYRQALQLRPSYAEAHSNLGWALGQLGHLEEAIASYQTALRVAPKDWPHSQFVQKKLTETVAELQTGKSMRVPAAPAPSAHR
jgi:tetratricopeptide (TPR) repeat protein